MIGCLRFWMMQTLNNNLEYRIAYDTFCAGFFRRIEFLEGYAGDSFNSPSRRALAYSLLIELLHRNIFFMIDYEEKNFRNGK